jgi:hypothetical protein
MALVIYDATDYDSFATVAEADTIVATYTLYDTEWSALSTITKEVYLRIAFRVIVDNLVDLPLAPASSCLKQAQALIAVQDLMSGISGSSEVTTGVVKKRKAGILEVEYFEPSSDKSGRTVIIPRLALPCLIELGWDGNISNGGFNQTTLGRS